MNKRLLKKLEINLCWIKKNKTLKFAVCGIIIAFIFRFVLP